MISRAGGWLQGLARTPEEWRTARLALLDAEKAHVPRSDELARMRQELPWVRVDKEYEFDTKERRETLADLPRALRVRRLTAGRYCLVKYSCTPLLTSPPV